jgi:site-specific DNA recombinase
MNVAIYARVSSQGQEQRGTIGSQVEVLRARMAAEGHKIVAEFLDDGYSGARLDRPGLDALRDAAQAGVIEAVWCLTPDRLARSYAYQMLVLDELDRLGCQVRFTDAPAIDDDPQARLLTQMQGVIAEYERAKIAERYRRGKLFKVRAGEAIFWKVPYGYRRVPRTAESPARLEIHEPEAAIVRGIFDEYTAGGRSMRAITRRLYEQGVPTPTGRAVWASSTLGGMLRNRTYMGTAEWFRHETVAPPAPGKSHGRQTRRPEEDWVRVPVPAIVTEEVFDAAQRVKTDNSMFSPRRTTPGTWLLRGLVVCGACNVKAHAQPMRSTAENGTRKNRYYSCYHHDALRAGGVEKRCTERRIRADELDAFVFAQIRDILLRPDVLLAGERAIAAEQPAPDDEILDAQLTRLARRVDQATAERRRITDLYQAGHIDMPELNRRATELDSRRRQLETQQAELTAQRHELAIGNRLRQRVTNFARQAADGIDSLDFDQRQRLLRLIVEQVRVQGWQVELRLRIPLDPAPEAHPKARRRGSPGRGVFSEDRLRSLGAIHPSGLPLARDRPDGTGRHFGIPLGSAPRRPRARRRTPGWGQAIEHGPGTTSSTSHQSILRSCSSLNACDLTSHHGKQQPGYVE